MRIVPNKGFTIVELLIVIVVIGIIASIVVVAYNGVATNAKDTRRQNDMEQIVRALMAYNVEFGRFPSSNINTQGEWETSGINPNQFLSALRTQGIIGGAIPVDPVNVQTGALYDGKVYNYYRYPAGSFSCDAARGGFFILGVRDMESSGNPHPESPGFACDTRNWQAEFDWVTGSFEN